MIEKHAADTRAMLAVNGLEAWYGNSHILHGVDFRRAAGEVVTLLGRNGVGKTTTLKVDHGHRRAAPRLGAPRRPRARRHVLGRDRARRHRLSVRRSAAFSPASMCGKICCCRRRCARAASISIASSRCFPICASGFQARAPNFPAASSRCWRSPASCAPAPGLLLLDEPTEGLAPVIIQQIRADHRFAESARIYHSSGRAEFPLRRGRRRPPLHHGAWPRRRRIFDPATKGECGKAARISRSLI